MEKSSRSYGKIHKLFTNPHLCLIYIYIYIDVFVFLVIKSNKALIRRYPCMNRKNARNMIVPMLAILLCAALLLAVTFWQTEIRSRNTVSEEPMVISVSGPNTSIPTDSHDPLLQYIYDKFNIRFEFISTGSYNDSDLYQLWAALDSMPDILMYDARWELNYFIRSGSLRSLPSNLTSYQNLSPYIAWPYGISLQYNDSIWGIPSMLFDSQAGMVSTCAIFYKDVYDAAWPYAEPPSTIGEWHTLLENIRNLDSGIIPLTSQNPESMYDLTYFYSPATNTWIWDAEHARYLPGYYTDSFLESIEALKPLWDDGLLDPDFMNVGSGRPSGLDKFMLSQAAGIMYSCSPYVWQSEFVPAWNKAHPDLPLDENIQLVFLPGNAEGEYLEAYSFEMNAIYFGSSVDDEKMDRILTMMNWLCSPEGRMLRQYGLEGKDYTLSDDGSISRLTESSGLYNKYPSYAFLRTLPDQDTPLMKQTDPDDASVNLIMEQYYQWREAVGIKTQHNTSITANTVSTPAVINFNPNILSNSFRLLTSDDIRREFDIIRQEYRDNGIELMINSVHHAL